MDEAVSVPWYTILVALALLGWLCVLAEISFKLISAIAGLFHRTNHYHLTQINYETHRDPTRPNFTDDESAAWLNVTAKMQQFEKRAIEGRKKP
jgi:hypothetical protein